MCVWVCECVWAYKTAIFSMSFPPHFPLLLFLNVGDTLVLQVVLLLPPPSTSFFFWTLETFWFDLIFFFSRGRKKERERERERERRKKEMEGKKEGIGLFRSGRFAPSVTDTFKCDDPTTIYWPLPNSQWQKFLLSKAADAPAASPGGSSQFNWWWWWSKKKFEARETRHHEANPRQTRP